MKTSVPAEVKNNAVPPPGREPTDIIVRAVVAAQEDRPETPVTLRLLPSPVMAGASLLATAYRGSGANPLAFPPGKIRRQQVGLSLNTSALAYPGQARTEASGLSQQEVYCE